MLKSLLTQDRERLIVKNLTTNIHKFIKKSDYTDKELEKIKNFYNGIEDHLICDFDETKSPNDYKSK